jgi:HEAT repeat protein
MDIGQLPLDLDIGQLPFDLMDVGPMSIDLTHLAFEPMAFEPLHLLESVDGLLAGAMAFEPQDRERERAERDRERAERERDAQEREREREQRVYEQAQEALDRGRYDRAIERFADVVTMKGTRADAALYWKAFAQDRQGQRAEALTTIADLVKTHPNSRYITQAKALEVEVRRNVGQPVRPENQSDDELRLMALNALQHSDPDQAIPMLEKLLQGTATPRLKDRALFVLAQSNSARARDVLAGIAKGNSTPELQGKAIQYLGVHGGRESRAALAEVYSATPDIDVKRRILRAFMVSGEKGRLLTAAQTEQNAQLRAEAVRQLGVMGAHEELWQLYQKESAPEVKKHIIHAMFVGGNATRMIDLAKTEQNVELRRAAVRNLGLMGSKGTAEALVGIYTADRDVAIRKAVVNALFLQDNAASLVALARKEENSELKKEIVQKLSIMRSKVATDYMLELLNSR